MNEHISCVQLGFRDFRRKTIKTVTEKENHRYFWFFFFFSLKRKKKKRWNWFREHRSRTKPLRFLSPVPRDGMWWNDLPSGLKLTDGSGWIAGIDESAQAGAGVSSAWPFTEEPERFIVEKHLLSLSLQCVFPLSQSASSTWLTESAVCLALTQSWA